MSTNCVAALVILVFAFILGEIRSTRSLCELGRYDKKKNRPPKGDGSVSLLNLFYYA